jgi:hypothetical protein
MKVMTKLIRPLLFSTYFKLDPLELEKRNLLDPILNADTKVFIDPLLLKSSSNKKISQDALAQLRDRFSKIIDLILVSERVGDPAWNAARKLLDLGERKETCLGFGGSSVSGSSRPDSLKDRVFQTTREIVHLGVKNPEIISLMGFLEDDVGPDTISDLTANAIWPALADITQQVCKDLKIPLQTVSISGQEVMLPANPSRGGQHGVLLVPRDIIRDLPIATDMSDVARVAFENRMIRERVNALIANFTRATIKEKKRVLKDAALRSADNFLELFEGLLEADSPYNVTEDRDGIYAFREALRTVASEYPFEISKLKSQSQAELVRIVNTIISQFKTLVEKNDLARLLWNKDSPRSEKAAQLLFYAVAEAYCKANGIEISPETNMGGGAVDFKFSSGGGFRYLVEIKLSSGSVVHGYEKQLEVYREAAGNADAALLVVNVGRIGDKLKKIQKIREDRIKAGARASDVHVIDASRKASASVR